ncbi:MAG TPA: protease inhibitor I42 family protein [Gaiellaceae bacterium]
METNAENHMVEVSVGGTFDVPLEGVPTSGFRWELSIPDEARKLIAPLDEKWEADACLPGGPAVQRFRFRASAPGEATLTFRYARPWEDQPPRDERTVSVRIEPAD